MKKQLIIGVSLLGVCGCAEFQQSQFYRNMQSKLNGINNIRENSTRNSIANNNNFLQRTSNNSTCKDSEAEDLVQDLESRNFDDIIEADLKIYLKYLERYKACDKIKAETYQKRLTDYFDNKRKQQECSRAESYLKKLDGLDTVEEIAQIFSSSDFYSLSEYEEELKIYKRCDVIKAKIYEEKINKYKKQKEKQQRQEEKLQKELEKRQQACEEELACSIRDDFEGKKDYLSIQYINIYDATCSLPQKSINQRLSDLSKFCSEDTVDGFKKAYEQFSEQKKEIAAAEEERKRFEKEKQTISIKYEKPFCDADPVRNKDCVGFLNRENLFGIPEWKVSQQTNDGTMIESRMASGLLGYKEPVLIMKNSTDSSLIDNETLPSGVFTRVGNYSYTTVLGVRKTIVKLKRLQ